MRASKRAWARRRWRGGPRRPMSLRVEQGQPQPKRKATQSFDAHRRALGNGGLGEAVRSGGKARRR
eukprot:scaffold329691_cov54-Tisochrysis_lutea.AAC.1